MIFSTFYMIDKTYFTKYSKVFMPGHKLIKANYPYNTVHKEVAICVSSSIIFQLLENYCYD